MSKFRWMQCGLILVFVLFFGLVPVLAMADIAPSDSRQTTVAFMMGENTHGLATEALVAAPMSVSMVVSPTRVDVVAPLGGVAGMSTIFTATVFPPTADLPITYTWEATDQPIVTHVITEISDSMTWIWAIPGVKSIHVTVANQEGSASNTFSFNVAPLAVGFSKSVVPADSVAAGGVLVYTLHYTNPADIALNLVITDSVSLDTVFIDAPEGVYDGTQVRWTPILPPGMSDTVSFRVRVPATLTVGTQITNVAGLSSTQGGEQSSNTTTNIVVLRPDFSLSTKTTDGDAFVYRGDWITYTFAYINNGSEDAFNVLLTDPLPDYVTYVDSSEGVYDTETGIVTFDLGDLAVEAGGQLTMTVQVVEDAPAGVQIANVAYIDSSQTEPLALGPVVQTVLAADFELYKAVTPTGVVSPGAVLTYTLIYTNVGNDLSSGVIITDPIPAGLIYQSGGIWSGEVVRWESGPVMPGTSVVLTWTAQLRPGAGLIENRAYIVAGDRVWASNSVSTPVAAAALQVSKSVIPTDNIAQYEVLTYSLHYVNTGLFTATEALLVDSLSAGIEYVSGGTYEDGKVRFPLGAVPPQGGGEVQFSARAVAPVGSVVTNTTWVFYDQFYPGTFTDLDPLDIVSNSSFGPVGGTSQRPYIAQSFIATAPRLARVGIGLIGSSLPYPNIRVGVWPDINGYPGLTQTLLVGDWLALSDSLQRYYVVVQDTVSLTVGARYWVGAELQSNEGNARVAIAGDVYSGGAWCYWDSIQSAWVIPNSQVPGADIDTWVEYTPPPHTNVVSTTVTDPILWLTVTPRVVTFEAMIGSNNSRPRVLSIENRSPVPVGWTAENTQPWLIMAATSGTTPSSLTVTVNVDGLGLGDYMDVITITGDPGVQNAPQVISVNLSVERATIYLPLILRSWPPLPPVLNPIDNPNGFKDYTVQWQWSAIDNASFVLQEAAQADFSDAVTIYSGMDTSFGVSDKGISYYFYRVQADYGDGITGWSNIESVYVRWEKENNDVKEVANGPLLPGLEYYGYPNTTGDQKDYFWLQMDTLGTITVDLYDHTYAGSGRLQLALWDDAGGLVS
ncbi:MAG: DUF11 domain-containing protein, partial [Anaerolineae bacterium]|nr:DUF11 domain-containing protein [Anaerolineae bacterium]